MIYALDTDHLSLIERGTVEGARIVERLRHLGPDDYGTTVVSFEEQCRGWANSIHRAQTPEARVRAYGELSARHRRVGIYQGQRI